MITKRLYNDMVYFVMSYRHVKEFAEDCAQDALIKIYLNEKYYDSQKGKFTTWAHMILYRTMLDKIKMQRMQFDSRDISEIEFGICSDPVNTSTNIDHIIYYLGTITKRNREPLLLKIQGYNYQEISDILQIPMGTVKSRIFRSKVELEKKLK